VLKEISALHKVKNFQIQYVQNNRNNIAAPFLEKITDLKIDLIDIQEF